MTTSGIPGKRRYSVHIGGRDRDFQLDLAAFAHAEDAFGGSLVFDAKQALGSFKGMRALLYGGLRRCDDSFTLDQLDEMVDFESLIGLKDQLLSAYGQAMPKEGDVPFVAEAEPAPV